MCGVKMAVGSAYRFVAVTTFYALTSLNVADHSHIADDTVGKKDSDPNQLTRKFWEKLPVLPELVRVCAPSERKVRQC